MERPRSRSKDLARCTAVDDNPQAVHGTWGIPFDCRVKGNATPTSICRLRRRLPERSTELDRIASVEIALAAPFSATLMTATTPSVNLLPTGISVSRLPLDGTVCGRFGGGLRSGRGLAREHRVVPATQGWNMTAWDLRAKAALARLIQNPHRAQMASKGRKLTAIH